jgi:hypothetical protein
MSAPSDLDGIVTTFSWDDAVEDLYASWRKEAWVDGHVHSALLQRVRRRSAVVDVVIAVAALGAAAIALAPVVAADAYSTATRGIDADIMRVAVASLAGLAAVLTMIRAIVRPGVRAERHRVAALRYRSLDRAMAAMLALPREGRPPSDDALAWVRERLTRYERESPGVGRRTWARFEAALASADAPTSFAPAPSAVADARSLAAT